LAARTRAGKKRISNPPLVLGDLVLVIDDGGNISAFRTKPISGAKRAAERHVPAESAPAAGTAAPPAAPAEPAVPPAAPPPVAPQ
jgi:hypothetical protein